MISDLYITDGYKVKSPTVTNSNGIETISWSAGTTISGRMRDLNGNEVIVNEKKGYTTTHRFYCDASVSINEKDIIYDVNDALYYEVVVVREPMKLNHHLEVDCEFKRDKQSNYE